VTAAGVRAARPARATGIRSLRKAGRRAYRGFGTVTAPLRLRPGFIMIGGQRCGTTSFFRTLRAHPQLMSARYRKGINYFDLNYDRGLNWYLGHFPVEQVARTRTSGYGEPVAFEASGYYLYHPFAIERLARDLPDVKLLVMLRDPVERAFSAYKHEYARGYEQETFERALELEDERLAGEADRMRDDISYESLSHRHHSYRHRGHYAEQLERVLAHFPAGQLHVMDSEAYFAEPARQYRAVLEFLGLRPFEPSTFAQVNARPGAPMPPETRKFLEEYFIPHNERLAELLGRPLSWASCI
jgi:hypothetical protein